MKYKIVVIGGGPAGYVAAIRASQLGAEVALVEQDILGGTCLNRGCIPTKAYLKNAEIIQEIKKASSRGIKLVNDDFVVDMPATRRMKNKVVKKLTDGVGGLLKSNKVDIFYGRGVLQDGNTVLVNGNKNEKNLLKADKIIIAGGSKASTVPIPGIESSLVLSSDEVLSMDTLPSSMVIIGGGVIGVEMALIFLSFGVKVEIIEMEDRLLPFIDSSISDFGRRLLAKNGAGIHTGVSLEKITNLKSGLTFTLSTGEILKAEKAMLSIGRVPELTCLGELHVKTDKGRILVNDYQETSIQGIYAAGDITGQKMLAHAAFKLGETAAENALGAKMTANLKYVPSVIYSLPEMASVGMSEEEATRKYTVSTGYFPLSANGKALAVGEADGFIKIVTDKKYGEVLGVHMAGPGVSEIINEAAALMAMEVTSHEIADIIHGHPSVGEAFSEAAADSLGRCIHLPPGSML
ncbi:MAG: dihydrolipoyl dehydrogenase [Spirochaetaceae bacterium]|nr:dihydrolipoyl dehydrogenase [Spirochaetaceae bacterium]